MSIRPIEFNGMVQRTQDISTMKQNEDNKPIVDQQSMVNKMQKDTRQHMKQVTKGEDAQQYQKKYDAREKGSNQYEYSGEKKKKKKKDEDGKVVLKDSKGGFDMKI